MCVAEGFDMGVVVGLDVVECFDVGVGQWVCVYMHVFMVLACIVCAWFWRAWCVHFGPYMCVCVLAFVCMLYICSCLSMHDVAYMLVLTCW